MSTSPLSQFTTLGEMLRYLRHRMRLTQLELSIAVGYSESQISRLEQNERHLDAATLLAVFVPALGIEDQPEIVERLLTLVEAVRTRSDANPTAADVAVYGLPARQRSNAASLTTLPVRLTSLIGRDGAITALCQLIPTTRLITLTGVGGVGKTSLAQAVGTRLAPHFTDGIWWVELAPLIAANLVPQAIFAVFKLSEPHEHTYLDALTGYCQNRHLLLILDNCEHVVGACAVVVDRLLRTCPQLHILTTSREALGVDGEAEWPVAPLAAPKLDAGTDDLRAELALQRYEAVHLFVERARAIQPSFLWSDQSAAPVAVICAQLDGIPLAIELAASRLRGMTVGEIAARLNDRFNLLTAGRRTALPRHQTLRAAVDWSYEMLSEAERALLRRMSVFAGGWALNAAEAIADVETKARVVLDNPLDLLLGLVNKSLILAETHDLQTRYRMLETIRHYAAEKLQELDETDSIRARHFSHYLALAEQSKDLALAGRRLALWLDRVETEMDNMRVAFSWSREQVDGGEQSLQLANALWLFWTIRGGFREGHEWLEEALARGSAAPGQMRGTALYRLADLSTFSATAAHRTTLVEEALVLCQQADDRSGAAFCYRALGEVAKDQSDFPRALKYYEQALDLFRSTNWLLYVGLALSHLADLHLQMGQSARAVELYEECLVIGRDIEERVLLSLSLECLFQIDPARGRVLFQQEIARQRKLEDPETLAVVLNAFGGQLRLKGDPQDLDESIDILTECLLLWRELGIKWGLAGGMARAYLFLGQAYSTKGEQTLAIEYEQEASHLYQEVGDLQGVAWAQTSIGWPALAQRNLALAFASFRMSLELSPDGSMNYVPSALVGLAETVYQQGDLVRAGRLFGAAAHFENRQVPRVGPLKNLPAIKAAHARLDNPTFAVAWAEGEAMALAEVIAYALE